MNVSLYTLIYYKLIYTYNSSSIFQIFVYLSNILSLQTYINTHQLCWFIITISISIMSKYIIIFCKFNTT